MSCWNPSEKVTVLSDRKIDARRAVVASLKSPFYRTEPAYQQLDGQSTRISRLTEAPEQSGTG